MERIVRTVCGDISPETLGRVSVHEHVVVLGGLASIRDNEFRLDRIDAICKDVSDFRESGGGALVDTLALSEGRSAEGLIEVSRRTGIHVIATTGFLPLVYYTDRHWIHVYSEERIADLLVSEIVDGMDELGYNGPDPMTSSARAGVIKVAADFHHISPTADRLFRAAGIAHQRTGAPLLVHTEQGTAAHAAVDLLESVGVPSSSILLSHLDRNPDIVLHEELAERGVMLSYDWLARIRRRPDSVITELIQGMVARGHADTIGLGMDLIRNSYWPAYSGGPGLRYLFGEFVPRLARAGVDEDSLQAICVSNPARFLAFVPREERRSSEAMQVAPTR
jgi:5-phospho-D-xylono-1,4-lactonase